MANKRAPQLRLASALVLAMMGAACAPTVLPLPMISAGDGRARAAAKHQVAPGGEFAVVSAPAR